MTTESPQLGRRNRRPWLVATGLLLIIALVIAANRRESLYERWLQTRSTDDLRQLAVDHDSDPLTNYVYARRLVETGAAGDASRPAARAVAALPPTAHSELAGRVLALSAYLTSQYGDPADAESQLQRAAQDTPNDLYAHLARGILALRQDRKADAVAELTQAVRIDAHSADAWRNLGRAYLLGAEAETAIPVLRRATSLAPQDPMIHVDLGQACLQMGQYPEALAEYQAAAQLLPNDPYYTTLPLRVVAFGAKTDADYTRARDLLRAALDRNPNDDGLRADLAGLYMRFGQMAAARQEIETVLMHNPLISADCWFNLYTVYKRLGDERAAKGAYARFRRLADLKIAVTALSKQIQRTPTDGRLFLRLSSVYQQLGQMDQSLSALTRAAALAPRDPEVMAALASAQAARQGPPGMQGPGAGGATLR